ncbi:MAG: SusC/RagA family TonB-linked outer membrane protein, partial [Tannerellaceae bacterium]|nr:SusC/RagA family TonB-linked outer membrane protein [Tannerellaceae bacterium]
MMRLTAFLLLFCTVSSYATGNTFPSDGGAAENETLPALQQQSRKVTGVVRDVNGEPVTGANIVEKGTTNGVNTDVNGAFSLNVQPGAILSVSFIGYLNQEVEVGRQTTLAITLREDTKLLDEVVIVGYGTQKKVNLTGSVSTVNVADIQSIPASNLSNALGGRLAGVTIMQSDGGRPGNASGIRIRANSSWNDNSPLYVIDGVARDKFAFDGLDAADIENLSILKDGASTAIYGSRSANGVVLVTTKKGKVGKPVISYTGTVGVSEITQIPETQDAYHQALFINDGLTTDGRTINDYAFYTPDELAYYKNNHHDWMAEGIENPIVTHHALNVSGGNDRVRYFIGGSYYYETGIFNRVDFDKYTLRGSVEANITKDLTASLDLNMDVRDDMKPYWV